VLTGDRKVRITGVVSGSPYLLDLDLMQFMMNLEHTKMLTNVQLKTKNRTFLLGEPTLNYEIETDLE
jgi:hypothetical protein